MKQKQIASLNKSKENINIKNDFKSNKNKQTHKTTKGKNRNTLKHILKNIKSNNSTINN